jgi:hypothetical protein
VSWTQPALKELATRLPTDDQALDDLIGEAVRQRDESAFRRLVFAAIGTERRVDARQLSQGSPLFLDAGEMAIAALHCAGNVGHALIEAARDGRMGSERMAIALTMAALWCRERANGLYPPELTTAARKLARMTVGNYLVQLTLRILAEATDDKALKSLLPDEPAPFLKDRERDLWDDALKSPWTCVPATPPPQVFTGYTVRRAVPRVGRNEPCPCGSGKKYKNCCIEKDQQRLRQSSALPGVTLQEWAAEPELGLTWERLRDMRSYELVKLDPHKVSESLRENLLDRLISFNELEAATQVLEASASNDPEDHFYWNWVAELAARRGETALLDRLMALRPNVDPASLALDVQLRLAHDDGARQLDIVENAVCRALRSENQELELVQIAFSLMASRARGLGLLVARGVLPLASGLDGDTLLMDMLEVRDHLGLSPDEPMEKIFEDVLSKSEENHWQDSEELTKARRALELKTEEVHKLKKDLISLHVDLEKLEKRQPSAVPSISPVPARAPLADVPSDPALTALRAKVRSLRELLKERHTERNALRRELEQTREQLEALHVELPPPAATAESGNQESLLLETEDLGHQPVRLPVWSKRFVEHFSAVPRTVARSVMMLVGRLAAGEPPAFAGVKRLRALPQVYRQRVAGDYRLLFQLRVDALELVDLVNRKDLDRCIKSLS